jgi:hypothetical protein
LSNDAVKTTIYSPNPAMKWATCLTEKSDARLTLNRPYLSAIRVRR